MIFVEPRVSRILTVSNDLVHNNRWYILYVTYIKIYKESFSTLKTSAIEIFKPKGCQSQLGSYIICSVIYTTTGHRPNEVEKGLEIE